MSAITMLFTFVIFAIINLGRKPIVRLFTTDAAVEELTNSCMLIIALVFIPDMVQGSMQGVIRALDVQKSASYIALAAFYLVTIPLAFVLVFVGEMGISGLWTGLLVGLVIEGTFYTRLVLKTDWQDEANAAEKRIQTHQANLCQT